MTRKSSSGKLRHFAHLERHNGAQDGRGNPDYSPPNWVFVYETWIEIVPITSREAEHAHQLHANATHTVQMRYQEPKPNPSHRLRVVANNRVLNIGAALSLDERRRRITLTVAEDLDP